MHTTPRELGGPSRAERSPGAGSHAAAPGKKPSLTPERCDELDLELMTAKNDTPYETPFTVTIEAREGVTTGISAHDRALTIRVLMDEVLNFLDRKYGVGSVVIHDSMFFQNPSWLEEWLEKYPRKANRPWPYWAAARADTVRQWPQLFEALVKETRWDTVSIGFESGSNRVLKILNKECTEEDNYFTIDLLTRIGDEMEQKGQKPPVFWSNIMLGIPGETHEDAFKTMRMVKYTKRILPSIAFYAPYPGSALGHQLIAEGKSLMTKENYHRFPDDEKVRGIDYYHCKGCGICAKECPADAITMVEESV